MDKIKYVKLEQPDGSYSDSIPLAVDADYVDVNGNTLTNTLGTLATKTEVQAVASGSPARVYATVAALTAADPDHNKIYLVSADGHWYYYNNNWIDGGVYQSTEIADESIDIFKLKENLAEKITTEIGYYSEYEFTIGGYIDYKNGSYSSWNNQGKYKCTNYINLKYCETLQFNGSSANDDSGFAFYDENKNYISGIKGHSIIPSSIINIPNNAIYVRGTSYDNTGVHNCKLILTKNSNIKTLLNTQEQEFKKLRGYQSEEIYADKNGYIDNTDGSYHDYSDNGKYKCTNFIELTDYDYFTSTMTFFASAKGAFYDENKTFVSGISSLKEKNSIPENAKYIRLSDYSENAQQTGYVILMAKPELENMIDDRIDYKNRIIINCVGDSVTEGMGTNGNHTANYGKEPYPARLYTILKDNGYNNITVNNYGHGGECIPEVSTRIGAIPCYISEDITIPADNSEISLGTYQGAGSTTGTKLKQLYSNKNGDDYCIYFTQTSHDTNPVYIDGIPYRLSVHDDANWIKKQTADNKETIIKAGTLVFTNDNRNPNINIVYAGINDGATLSLQRFIDNMKACANVTGKYIILGCTHPFFNNWSGVEGNTFNEKYSYYKRKCLEAFGNNFIDLYDEFSRHALDYALSSGYFSNKTSEELETISNLLQQHIIPADFTVSNNQNDVHLNEAGYQVIALLIFDRLKRLNYI